MNEITVRIVKALSIIAAAKVVYNLGRLDEKLRNNIQKVVIKVD